MDNNTNNNWSLKLKFLVLFSFLAGTYMFWIKTSQGLGATPDTINYLKLARKYAEGNFTLNPWRPPLYPAVLCIMKWVTGVAHGYTFILHGILFGATGFVLGLLLLHGYEEKLSMALAGMSFFIFSSKFLLWYRFMLTEGLFLFLFSLYLWFTYMYLRTGNRTYLLLYSICIGLGCLTRFAGIPMYGTGLLAPLLCRQKHDRSVFREIMLFLFVAGGPFLLLLITNKLLTGKPIGAPWTFRSIPLNVIMSGMKSFSLWALPEWVPARARIVFFWTVPAVILSGSLFLNYRSKSSEEHTIFRTFLSSFSPFQWLLLIYCAGYGLFIVAANIFLSKNIPFSFRIMSPFIFAGIPLMMFCIRDIFNRLQHLDKPGEWKMGIGIAFLLYFLLFTGHGIWKITSMPNMSPGYASRVWENLRIFKKIKQLPDDTKIFTNGPDVLYFRTGRTGTMIPHRIKKGTRKQRNPDVKKELRQMVKTMIEKNGVIVYFHPISRYYLVTQKSLEQFLPLKKQYSGRGGVIYRVNQEKIQLRKKRTGQSSKK